MSDTVIVAECADGSEVLAAVQNHRVDVILLDIQMPNLTGLDALALLGSGGPSVVFVTAWAEHAVQAFDRGAVDYVLKPVEPERLRKALDRVRQRSDTPADPISALGRLPLATSRGIVLLDIALIDHASIDGESVMIEAGEARYYTDLRLSELERRLPSDRFERVHRTALVNLAAIDRLEPVETGGYVAWLRGGARVRVSRQAARQLRKRWRLR